MQLCHPDVVNQFPPLHISKAVVSQRLPVQLTNFVGRDEQLTQVRELLNQNRLVTLTPVPVERVKPGWRSTSQPSFPASSARFLKGFGMWIWRRSPTRSWCP